MISWRRLRSKKHWTMYRSTKLLRTKSTSYWLIMEQMMYQTLQMARKRQQTHQARRSSSSLSTLMMMKMRTDWKMVIKLHLRRKSLRLRLPRNSLLTLMKMKTLQPMTPLINQLLILLRRRKVRLFCRLKKKLRWLPTPVKKRARKTIRTHWRICRWRRVNKCICETSACSRRRKK